MILADTSVWIDYLRGNSSDGAERLDRAIAAGGLVMGDLILAEILRGVKAEREASRVQAQLLRFELVSLGGRQVAIEAARNWRIMRKNGVTIRGTIDLIIGTWCILTGTPLIHADRDFEGMELWSGLKRWTD